MSDVHRRSFAHYMVELDGQSLSPAQQAEIQAHLSSCSACQLNLQIYRSLQTQALRRWPVVAAPPEIETRLRKVGMRTRLPGLVTPLRAAAWVGLIVLALIVAEWLFTSLRPAPAILPVSSPTPQVFDSPNKDIAAFSLPSVSGRQEYDYLGASVDIDGDVLVAGAPVWNSPGVAQGSAYVFRKSAQGEWRIESTLVASDRDAGSQRDQHFGEAVAIQGNVIAVGAPGADDSQVGENTGAVYIFESDGQAWVETDKLVPAIKSTNAKIGRAIAFEGDYLAASGAPEARSVAIFQRTLDGWREMAPVIVPASEDANATYALLDLYGDTLAVSTVNWNPLLEPKDLASQQAWAQSLQTTGIVTLYEHSGDGWVQVFQTGPQEVSLYSMRQDIPFGLPVALSGESGRANLLAVGKPGFPNSGRESGSVAIYERTDQGWQPQAELALADGNEVPGSFAQYPAFADLFPDPAATFFGTYIELRENRLSVVSAFANAAYVFERQGQAWVYQFRVTPGAEYFDDFQRRTVALNGSTLLLSSPGELGGGMGLFLFMLNQ